MYFAQEIHLDTFNILKDTDVVRLYIIKPYVIIWGNRFSHWLTTFVNVSYDSISYVEQSLLFAKVIRLFTRWHGWTGFPIMAILVDENTKFWKHQLTLFPGQRVIEADFRTRVCIVSEKAAAMTERYWGDVARIYGGKIWRLLIVDIDIVMFNKHNLNTVKKWLLVMRVWARDR